MKFDLATSTEELGVAGVAVVDVLSGVLARMIQRSRHCAGAYGLLTKFQSSCVPGISVLDYLRRISSYAKCSDSCFVIALIYIDRLIESRGVVLTDLNVHRIVITTVLIAAKMYEDEYFNNPFYARLGGISVAELNILEIEFVKLIGFSTHVDVPTFNRYFMEFWKLDMGCLGKPLPHFILEGMTSAPSIVPPTPFSITRSLSVESGPPHSPPAVDMARGPQPTIAMRFPMPVEYSTSEATAYVNSVQGAHVLAGAGCGHAVAYPPSAGFVYDVSVSHAAGRSLKVQTDFSPYGAVNFGMGYARSDSAGFVPPYGYNSPYSVSSKMSPFERRAEEA